MTTYYVKNLTIIGEDTTGKYIYFDGTEGGCNVFSHPNTFSNATRLWVYEYWYNPAADPSIINLIEPSSGVFKLNKASPFEAIDVLQNFSFTNWKRKVYLTFPNYYTPGNPSLFASQLANQFELLKNVAGPFGVDLGFQDSGVINIMNFYIVKGVTDETNYVIPVFYQGNQSPYDHLVEV